MLKNTTTTVDAVVALIRARSADQRLSTVDFIAEELELSPGDVRAALAIARVHFGVRQSTVGNDLCYSV